MIRVRVSDLLVALACRVVARLLFRVRVIGRDNIPAEGPALIAANHVTPLDAFLIGSCVGPAVGFLVWRPYFELKPFKWALRLARAIPVGTDVWDVSGCVRDARRELERGRVVCIFPEGSISRNGELLPFKRGLEMITQGTGAKVVPVHLGGLWGSTYSFAGGRPLSTRPSRVRHPVTISFGSALHSSAGASEVRETVRELAARGGPGPEFEIGGVRRREDEHKG